MNTDNLKKVLSVVRDLIKRNRVAYKDYLGEETITETKVFAKGTFAENGAGLTCDDPTITSIVAGETYQITIDGETTDYVAIKDRNIILVGNVTDETKPRFSIGFESGNVVWDADESLLGKTVSVSQTKTVTHKNYDIKKLPEELLPDSAATDKDVKRINSIISDMHIATKKYVDSKEFISSSTEGSTKKFKITVDDTGTITATEVTEPAT